MIAIDSSTASEVMNWTNWIALGIGVAAFAGTIWSNITAQRALRATGLQRVAEFRKEWLEDLRSDLAELISQDQAYWLCVREIDDVELARKKDKGTLKLILDQKAVDLVGSKEQKLAARAAATARILLRLNEDQGLYGELLNTISGLLASKNIEASTSARALLVTCAGKLFKCEWDKLLIEMKS